MSQTFNERYEGIYKLIRGCGAVVNLPIFFLWLFGSNIFGFESPVQQALGGAFLLQQVILTYTPHRIFTTSRLAYRCKLGLMIVHSLLAAGWLLSLLPEVSSSEIRWGMMLLVAAVAEAAQPVGLYLRRRFDLNEAHLKSLATGPRYRTLVAALAE